MTGPAVGESDPGRAARSRTGLRDAAGGVVGLLVLGLAFRLIIAYLLPNAGFDVDIQSFRYWADNLASQGLGGFYDRPFFHDYTPGYLYVLWLVGKAGELSRQLDPVHGGVGDLIKIPAILADLGLGWVVWSMAKELGATSRVAFIGAFLVIVNPVSWLDSTVWGQVDSVGTLVMLLALRELWRDRPERSAVLAMLAALIKPQLGILIPIVAIVVIRRALKPDGGYGDEAPPAPGSATAWERSTRGPIRIATTAIAGLVTAIALAFPFGLGLPGLIQQIFKTAGGYPFLSANAYNPWALVSRDGAGIAANGTWICDSTVQPSGPVDIRIGNFLLWHAPASTTSCADGFMVGALPAVLVGAGLFLIVATIVMLQIARRPERRTMLVGLAVLALAFFVLPTRVHERYLYPLIGIAAILAAVSFRWWIAYIASSIAIAANMYAILTWIAQYHNPGIADWLGIRPFLASFWGIAAAAAIQLAVFVWAFSQLRDDRLDQLEEEITQGAQPDAVPLLEGGPGAVEGPPLGVPAASVGAPVASVGAPAPAPSLASPAAATAPAGEVLLPAWDDRHGAAALGPLDWVRARFRDRPIRADRSRTLGGESGGRIDRLDLWLLAVLVISLLTVRIWRLSEPYSMHFDEVYHARTATEFLQDWRYGISQYIYEWTHPHLAKYAMALGIEAWGGDSVDATSDLGVAVTGVAIEPRWDDASDHYGVKGDRLWVATGGEVRAYDLSTRALIGTEALPGATALAVDRDGHRLFVGLADGSIRTIDTTALDVARAAGTPPSLDSTAWMQIDGSITQLFTTRNASVLAAVLPASTAGDETVALIDPTATTELGRATLPAVTQLADGGTDRIAVADADGVAFLDETNAKVQTIVRLAGPAGGVASTSDLSDNPLYASYEGTDGPKVVTITGLGSTSETPHQDTSFRLPGQTAGWVFFDQAVRMVHVVGSVPGSPTKQPTVYVVEPHATDVYADAALPITPAAIVMDDNGDYPSTDRQQLLAIDGSGSMASVEIGRHAWAWRLPGVLAGVAMAALLYLLARLLFRRRSVAVILAVLMAADGMLFVQSRIGMNDSYVGLGIVAAYTLFAALWLRPGDTRRHWIAFWIGMPIIGVFLGLALASKWVAAYAIGGLGILFLARSALGRLLLMAALVVLTTVLGYLAISVPAGTSGGNYVFLVIMVGLTLGAVAVNILHPIAWTWEEERFAVAVPILTGAAIVLAGMTLGDPAKMITVGHFSASAIELGFLCFVGAAAVYSTFVVAGRFGFGPRAQRAAHDGATDLLEPPAAAPVGWLRIGSGLGLPAIWTVVGLLVIPLVVYVISYIPWAMVEGHQIVAGATPGTGWPPGHTGQTLLDLTAEMYRYHNTLSVPHPASSPWWAWPFDFKPVWFYEEGFAGGTSASIYDAGNLVAWWLAIPAMGFVAWQAYKRRSTALGLVAIGFACQWLSWSRIDRAAFQYHYYTALPFLLIALAYFLAELWHGPSWRTWVLARVAAGVAILAPFGLWLFHRPLCGFVRVTDVNPGSQACPTYIPDLSLSPRTLAIAIVVGIGVLLLVRILLTLGDTDDGEPSSRHAQLDRLRAAAVIAVGVSVAFVIASNVFPAASLIQLKALPVEPITLVVTLALMPVAAFVVTARDSRRFVVGALLVIAFWFVIWYPNIAALPLPSSIHNAYQGLLPTYVYPFQFPVSTVDRNVAGPPLLSPWVAALLATLTLVALAVAYSAWTWRIVLAERRRDREALVEGATPAGST